MGTPDTGRTERQAAGEDAPANEPPRHSDALSRDFFRSLIEHSYDAMVVADRQGCIVYQSPPTHEFLGYAEDEVLGRNVMDFPHPHDRPGVERMLASVMEEPRASRSLELRLRHRNGTWRWAEVRATNLLDDPAVEGIVLNTLLVHQRKALELEQLASRLDPHFLYNTLNTVAGLIRDGMGAEAVEAIARLRDLLERGLRDAEHQFVPLAEEFGWVREYLELERLRFGADLATEVGPLPEDLRSVQVPHRLLQPLVENAVKHGIRARSGRGTVRVAAGEADGCVRIEVVEEGEEPVRGSTPESLGVGLRTTRERLHLHFGDAASFTLHVENLRSTALVTLPLVR